MKHTIFAAFLALALAFSAAAGPAPRLQPVVTVSCNLCSADETIVYTGSGFKQGASVYLAVDGPESSAITVTINSAGGFSVNFGGSLSYSAGSYTVTAYSLSGKRATPVASASFTVGQ